MMLIMCERSRSFRAVIAKRGEVAAVATEIKARSWETDQIFRDQERLRKNLKALKGSAEEKTLVARCTRQLDGQETRRETIKREVADCEARRAKLQSELDSLVQGIAVEK